MLSFFTTRIFSRGIFSLDSNLIRIMRSTDFGPTPDTRNCVRRFLCNTVPANE